MKVAPTKQGRDGVVIAIGGVISPGDYAALTAAGAAPIFPPGTAIAEAAVMLTRALHDRRVYEAQQAAGASGGVEDGVDS